MDKITFTVSREDLARLIAEAQGHRAEAAAEPTHLPGAPPFGRKVPAWQVHGLPLAESTFALSEEPGQKRP